VSEFAELVPPYAPGEAIGLDHAPFVCKELSASERAHTLE
jgi:hypothetical protein